MKNAFSIVKDFEDAVAEYTNAPYVVAVNSCTNALFLCLKYYHTKAVVAYNLGASRPSMVEIPTHTYVGVAQSILNAGYLIGFRDEDWLGQYQLKPFNIWDCAKWFSKNMFPRDITSPTYQCTSHHWTKTLGLQQGGCILHNDPHADIWFRRARFDGRTEGVKPKDDTFIRGYHMYMSPEVAALGLVKMMHLPKVNYPQPNDDYPDLSEQEIFQ